MKLNVYKMSTFLVTTCSDITRQAELMVKSEMLFKPFSSDLNIFTQH